MKFVKSVLLIGLISLLATTASVISPSPASAEAFDEAFRTGVGRSSANPSGLVLGDSLCVGATKYGGNLEVNLKRVLGTYQIHCKVGQGVRWGISEVEKMSTVPKVVAIHLGTNPSVNATRFKDEVRQLTSDLRKKGGRKIAWQTSTTNKANYASTYEAQNLHLFEQGKWRNMRFVVRDWAAKISANPEWYGPDNVHYTTLGKKRWSSFMKRTILDTIASPSRSRPTI